MNVVFLNVVLVFNFVMFTNRDVLSQLLFKFPDRKVFLAMWKDIPASNEVQKTFHCNVGSGKVFLCNVSKQQYSSQLPNFPVRCVDTQSSVI